MIYRRIMVQCPKCRVKYEFSGYLDRMPVSCWCGGLYTDIGMPEAKPESKRISSKDPEFILNEIMGDLRWSEHKGG